MRWQVDALFDYGGGAIGPSVVENITSRATFLPTGRFRWDFSWTFLDLIFGTIIEAGIQPLSPDNTVSVVVDDGSGSLLQTTTTFGAGTGEPAVLLPLYSDLSRVVVANVGQFGPVLYYCNLIPLAYTDEP